MARVMKAYDYRTLNPETYEVFYKPTDCQFDYLTDLLLCNCIFADAVRLEGFYEEAGAWFIIISQPFIDGRHAKKGTVIEVLTGIGLRYAGGNQFKVDGGPAGELTVTDIHEGNIMFDRRKNPYVIDAHFKFGSRTARIKALCALGLWSGSTP